MTEMNVIEMDGRGAADVMRFARQLVPESAPGEVLIRTHAIGVNRVDIMQRTGPYTPPYGITDVPGVELSGEVAAIGDGVTGFAIDDAVCGLVVSGGYAEYCAVPQTQVLHLPKDYDHIHGAALPEVHFTVWTALMQHGRYKPGESLLVHGGSSGIGTTAIMLARALGDGEIYATAGNEENCHAADGYLEHTSNPDRTGRTCRTSETRATTTVTCSPGKNDVSSFRAPAKGLGI